MSEVTRKSDQQKGAEAEVESFRKDLGPFVVAAETTRMAMVFTDATKPDNPIIFANDSFLSLTGYNREEVLGKSSSFLMAHGPDADALTPIKAEFEGSSGSRRSRSPVAIVSIVHSIRIDPAALDRAPYFTAFVASSLNAMPRAKAIIKINSMKTLHWWRWHYLPRTKHSTTSSKYCS
jgi:PAS domain-containing protein